MIYDHIRKACVCYVIVHFFTLSRTQSKHMSHELIISPGPEGGLSS